MPGWLVAWFDLYPRLSARLSDAKGELPLLFEGATSDLAALSAKAGVDASAAVFTEALSTRLTAWAIWIGHAAETLQPELAGRLVVGVGNIYASEVLFLARINPLLPAASIGPRRARRPSCRRSCCCCQ